MRNKTDINKLMDEMPQMFDELISGVSYAKIANYHKTTKQRLMQLMANYKPYKLWLLARVNDRSLLREEVKDYLAEGQTIRFLSELYCMEYSEMRKFVHEIEVEESKQYVSDVEQPFLEKHITVADVERFKVMVNVGELLIYGQSEDGVLLYCKILKKHLWFATTDQGCIDWNWLCINNTKRYYDNEIIWGE